MCSNVSTAYPPPPCPSVCEEKPSFFLCDDSLSEDIQIYGNP